MIYEAAVVVRPGSDESRITDIKEKLFEEVVKQFKGESLFFDDWGERYLAQRAGNGLVKGHYLYFIYTGGTGVNVELQRRMRIHEDVHNSMIIQAGDDSQKEKILKDYKNPFQATDTDESGHDLAKDRKMFSRKKSCWFSARKKKPNWKDIQSYAWLVNEFGKITPARVSGIAPRFQRSSTVAIKRGRNIGFLSHLSNKIAE